jgi:hypothetical protein
MFYSEKTSAFYDPAIHGEALPADAVEITRQRHGELLDGLARGQRVVIQAGQPVLIDPPPPDPPTREDIEAARLRAYADPLTGSDRYFAEAQRESLLGNAEAADAAKALGMARFAEIQAEYPWP